MRPVGLRNSFENALFRSAPEEPGALISRPGYDLDFHDLLFQAAHSPLLEERYRVSQGQLKLLVMFDAGRALSVAQLKAVNEEHRMVYWAISRHWPDAAETLIRRHIDKARRIVLHALPVVDKKTRRPKAAVTPAKN